MTNLHPPRGRFQNESTEIRPCLLVSRGVKFSENYARACALVVTKPPVWSNARSFKKLPAPSIIPVGPRWCEVRQTVFGWTTRSFHSASRTAHALIIREPHVITVTSKAFYDIGYAPADHSNRRSTPKGYAVWEIHPVMKMEVIP